MLIIPRVRVYPRVRVGPGRNFEYGSGTGSDNIMGYGYGSGSTNAVPADLYDWTINIACSSFALDYSIDAVSELTR